MEQLMFTNKWVKRFLDLALHISEWSQDPSTKVASVIVSPDKRVVSLGFNGYAAGIPDDDLDNREEKIKKIVHSEMNALLFAGKPVRGFALFCTNFPCSQCKIYI